MQPYFEVLSVEEVPEYNVACVEMVHTKTGAKWMHCGADDPNNVFNVAFRTTPTDSTAGEVPGSTPPPHTFYFCCTHSFAAQSLHTLLFPSQQLSLSLLLPPLLSLGCGLDFNL